jgi:hypothetical protein
VINNRDGIIGDLDLIAIANNLVMLEVLNLHFYEEITDNGLTAIVKKCS